MPHYTPPKYYLQRINLTTIGQSCMIFFVKQLSEAFTTKKRMTK